MAHKTLKTNEAVIHAINGPVVQIRQAHGFSMNEMVLIGHDHLLGEVIELDEERATIQVYEDTVGLQPGTSLTGQGLPLYAELGPGLLGNIFDGIQRPLAAMYRDSGSFITKGKSAALERNKTWRFKPVVGAGETVSGGQTIGEVQETDLITHRVMIPPHGGGRIIRMMPEGLYTIDEPIARLQNENGETLEIRLYQKWPVRRCRPCARRLVPAVPLFTGQRVIDCFFPLAKGGTAAIPGGFGTGKTITQHQLSKWVDADIIVYIGCGERGNEMAGVLMDFPNLLDPRNGRPLIERTIFVANTSDMPVTAREASIYTGITMAEYYRDMGYHVALMADSTSRWAEALREIAGRLEEMPAEEGFPAYLASRLAEFYERAGFVETLDGRSGSVSVIGAVSPPGSDFSEPVTQHTKRYVTTFWALDKELAAARYFPAINYLNSYSGYAEAVTPWWRENGDADWMELRNRALAILKEDARLMNIVKLIGEDALPEDQKAVFQGARLIKENFLQQSAFDAIDTYAGAAKQIGMLRIILRFIEKMRAAVVPHRIPVYRIMSLPVLEDIERMKYTYKGDDLAPFTDILQRVDDEFASLLKQEI